MQTTMMFFMCIVLHCFTLSPCVSSLSTGNKQSGFDPTKRKANVHFKQDPVQSIHYYAPEEPSVFDISNDEELRSSMLIGTQQKESLLLTSIDSAASNDCRTDTSAATEVEIPHQSEQVDTLVHHNARFPSVPVRWTHYFDANEASVFHYSDDNGLSPSMRKRIQQLDSLLSSRRNAAASNDQEPILVANTQHDMSNKPKPRGSLVQQSKIKSAPENVPKGTISDPMFLADLRERSAIRSALKKMRRENEVNPSIELNYKIAKLKARYKDLKYNDYE